MHSDRTDPPTWEVVHDVVTGRMRVHVHEARDLRVNPTTVVRRDYTMIAEVDRDDSRDGQRADGTSARSRGPTASSRAARMWLSRPRPHTFT